jgi:hypothetical protein
MRDAHALLANIDQAQRSTQPFGKGASKHMDEFVDLGIPYVCKFIPWAIAGEQLNNEERPVQTGRRATH